MELFFELIQVSLGNRDRLCRQPSESEWRQLYALAEKQSLTGVLLEGVEKLKSIDSTTDIPQALLLNWIGEGLQIEAKNKLLNERSKELYEILSGAGLRGCILKGQGTAQYYPHAEYRQCGDIDMWVEGDRKDILDYVNSYYLRTEGIDVQHTNVKFFEDVEVELHFIPSFMYSPLTNRRLQEYFKDNVSNQFVNYDASLGFPHTTIDFDIVFSLVHIYRHIFSEGIGLRQLVDYYYILQHSSLEQRQEAYKRIETFKMSPFAGGIMWILVNCFGMKEGFVLCPTNEKHGRFLITEIMKAGNFGHYDERVKRIDVHKRLHRGIYQLKRNLRFVTYYPSEVLWSPLWKTWHWCWRRINGYL